MTVGLASARLGAARGGGWWIRAMFLGMASLDLHPVVKKIRLILG